MQRAFAHFEPYFSWLEETVDGALAHRDAQALVAAADAFARAYLLRGYSAAAQISWLASKLADPRFVTSGHVHDFALDFETDAALIDEVSRRTLSNAYLRALSTLESAPDLVVAMGFLVRNQSSQRSLETIETGLLRFAADERLRAFVYDAMRMYAQREDLSPQQRLRVRELASVHFG